MTSQEEDAIRSLLRAHEGIAAAWLFGSAARGDERAASDLDVAVLGPASLSASDKKSLIEQLAQISNRPVDLIDLQETRGPIVGRILQTGTRLFCDDPPLYADLLKQWWFDQADWMPYRRRILKARRERWIGT